MLRGDLIDISVYIPNYRFVLSDSKFELLFYFSTNIVGGKVVKKNLTCVNDHFISTTMYTGSNIHCLYTSSVSAAANISGYLFRIVILLTSAA